MKKKITSLLKNTNIKHFILSLGFTLLIGFSISSVVASGDQTLKFLPINGSTGETIVNRIGSLSVDQTGSASWINPFNWNKTGAREECITTYGADDKKEIESCLDVNGSGFFSKLIVLDIPAYFQSGLSLNPDGNIPSGLNGLFIEDDPSSTEDSIMATGLQRNDVNGFAPRDTTTLRELCANAESGKLYVCNNTNHFYYWDIGPFGECSSSQGSCLGVITEGNSSSSSIGKSGPYSTCFVKNTKITMADGTEKEIQNVKIGDVLKGNKRNNTVIGFHQPKLGNKKLYSFNGGRYFVTAEHPFMTTEGWKAFNPDLAKKEHNINIKIGKLKIGDTLVTENGNILLKKVNTKYDKSDTQLYNFILDGNNTYYADGYLVHNKTNCDAMYPCQGEAGPCVDSSTGVVVSSLESGVCTGACSTPGVEYTYFNGSNYCPLINGEEATSTYCGSDYETHCLYNNADVPITNSGSISDSGANCSLSNPQTSTECISQSRSCSWESTLPVATRDVVCKDELGNIVTDQICIDNVGEKPVTSSDDPNYTGGDICLIDGSCNNSVIFGCATGVANSNAISDTVGFYRWVCEGVNGGVDSGICKKERVSQQQQSTAICGETTSHTAAACNSGSVIHHVLTTRDCTNGSASNYDPNEDGDTVGIGESVGGVSGSIWTCIDNNGVGIACETPPDARCFVADTKVVMANGSIKNIQEVKIGEYVMGNNGNVSKVKNIHMPKLGDRKDNRIYSFNGGRYFVTAEHPFMTTEGWKAIDPLWSKEEHPEMSSISHLNIGDVLVTKEGNVKIKSINFEEREDDTQLYNLMLGGNHTYYADGYLVHNKKCTIN